MADVFAKALDIAREHWGRLGSADWSDWYHGSPLEQRLGELNDEAWRIWHESKRRLFTHWIAYARQFPERLISADLFRKQRFNLRDQRRQVRACETHRRCGHAMVLEVRRDVFMVGVS